MKILLPVAALLLTAQLAAAAPEPTVVEGTLVDRDTGRGIPRVRLELQQRHKSLPFLMEPAPTFLAATTTDAKGRFRFVGPWRGRMRVRCVDRARHLWGDQMIEGTTRGLRIEPDQW